MHDRIKKKKKIKTVERKLKLLLINQMMLQGKLTDGNEIFYKMFPRLTLSYNIFQNVI